MYFCITFFNNINNNIMEIKFIKKNEGAVQPIKGTEFSAGFDLTANSINYDEYGNIVYGTGIAVEIPEGYVGLLFPRSSIRKKNMAQCNAVGIIDSDYRGEIIASFKPTLGEKQPYYQIGDRIAQLVIIPYPKVEYVEVENLSETVRGEGGHGSTGK